MKPEYIFFFDTETTGVDPKTDRVVEIAWLLCTAEGKIVLEETRMIKPEGFTIPEEAATLHGITTEIATAEGEDILDVLTKFFIDMRPAGLIVGHNITYDIDILTQECLRSGTDISQFREKSRFCTMRNTVDYCKISHPNARTGYKFPKLAEAFEILTGNHLIDCHDALIDTEACKEVFFKGIEKGIFQFNEIHPTVLVEVCR